jgi:phenylpropionate dioxygenase-like ring-hydroxylating dioxygenase large terminal subunit
MFLRNVWYVASWADEVGDGLYPVEILGEKICLFRSESGTPVAFENYCPHRRLPLSMGRLKGDQLECAYHGLTFGLDGFCISAPTNDQQIPAGALVRRYPCEERYGLIWIWMGDADQAALEQIFTVEHFDDPAWGYNRGEAIDVECHYEYINDNLLDPSHVAWVHASTFGESSTRDTPVETQVTNNGVIVSRWMFDCDPAPFYQKVITFSGRCDRLQHYEVRYPSHAIIRAVFTPAGHGGPGQVGPGHDSRGQGRSEPPLHPDAFVMNSYNFMTPVNSRHTRYYWFQMRNVRADDESVSRMMSDGIRAAFEEDRVILNALQRGMDERPTGTISMRSDFGGFQFRRGLQNLIEAEQVKP